MKDSFWIKEIKDSIAYSPSLDGDINTDIAIIGGGFVGLWTAILIKEKSPKTNVVILEKNFCGSGASGRNGGMVMSWWPKIHTLIQICGIQEALMIAQESEKCINEIGAFCETHQIEADFEQAGWFWTATTEKQKGAWNSVKKLTEDNGFSIYKDIPISELAKKSGSDAHLEGVIEESNAIVQPAKLAQGLKKVALSMGITIYENTSAESIIKTNPAKIITQNGSVTAPKVIIANNAWSATFEPELAKSILVVTSTIVATKPIPEKLDNMGWTGKEAITDSQLMVGYYRTTADNRIAYGKGTGGIYYKNKIGENFGKDPSFIEDTVKDFKRTYSEITDSDIEHDWSGPIDRTYDSFPLFGYLTNSPNIIYGVGWSGNGVGPSRMGGKILSSMALEEDNHLTNLKIINRKVRLFPNEPIRYIGGNLVRQAVRRNEQAAILNKEGSFLDIRLAKFAPSGLEDKN